MKKQSDTSKRKTSHGVLVRMPVPLHRRLKAEAIRERRSVTGQIIYLLEGGLSKPSNTEDISA